MLKTQGGLLYEKVGDAHQLTEGVDDKMSPIFSYQTIF